MVLLPLFAACADSSAALTDAIAIDTDAMLAAHNAVREEYGVPDLAWSDDLSGVAEAWSQHLGGAGCELVHSEGKYGENLYWTSASAEPAEVVDAWAGEVADYDYDANACAEGAQCGHYTQLVWADTTDVGCGAAECPDGGEVWTCNYDPPGNYVGEKPY